MFTGIIEAVGEIVAARRTGSGMALTVSSGLDLSAGRIGDSIAVAGACLTVTALHHGGSFSADVSPETLSRTTLGRSVPGGRVNLERAMPASGRFDGHLVYGHIDGTATVASVARESAFVTIGFSVLAPIARWLVEKGAVAVDGASLTVNRASADGFSVAVIPATLERTTLAGLRPGDRVNVEADIVAKYVERLTGRAGGLDRAFLQRHGFD